MAGCLSPRHGRVSRQVVFFFSAGATTGQWSGSTLFRIPEHATRASGQCQERTTNPFQPCCRVYASTASAREMWLTCGCRAWKRSQRGEKMAQKDGAGKSEQMGIQATDASNSRILAAEVHGLQDTGGHGRSEMWWRMKIARWTNHRNPALSACSTVWAPAACSCRKLIQADARSGQVCWGSLLSPGPVGTGHRASPCPEGHGGQQGRRLAKPLAGQAGAVIGLPTCWVGQPP
jgi:hypothetical protein